MCVCICIYDLERGLGRQEYMLLKKIPTDYRLRTHEFTYKPYCFGKSSLRLVSMAGQAYNIQVRLFVYLSADRCLIFAICHISDQSISGLRRPLNIPSVQTVYVRPDHFWEHCLVLLCHSCSTFLNRYSNPASLSHITSLQDISMGAWTRTMETASG